MRFAGKVLLATGAGSGIAAATAAAFAQEGGSVALLDMNFQRANDVAKNFANTLPLQCDVSDERSVSQAVSAVAERFGRIDCLLNSAGHVLNKPIRELTLAEWNTMLAVHVTGTFLVCRECLPLLKAAGAASIVNMSSVAALAGTKNLAAYSAAKGAVLSLTRQMAIEFAGDGIRVNAVVPGSIETPMSTELAIDRGGGDYTKGIQPVIDTTPLGRIGTPEEVAKAILFLLSEDAGYFTGTTLTPDGGRTAR